MENELLTFFQSLDFTSVLWQIVTPLLFCVADVFSGFIQAVINGKVDSAEMRKGLLRKSLLILIIVLGVLISVTFNIFYISKGICIYIIVMEIVSIFENLSKAGINIDWIIKYLKIKEE